MLVSEEVLVSAEPSTLYRVAANVAEWPPEMPYIRWVRIAGLAGNRVCLVTAARIGILPLWWHSEQAIFQDEARIVFRHVGGPTDGMTSDPRFEPAPSGTVETAASRLDLGWPLDGWMAEAPVIVRGISHLLACLTLSRLKRLAEAEQVILARLEGESLATSRVELFEGE